MEALAHLDELTETMKLAAALGGILLALLLLFPWMRPTVVPTWKTRVLAAATAIFVLPIAIGSGSCVLGGFIQGSGFCSFQGRDGTWDPVADFYSTQAMYSLVFLLTAFLAVLAVLALLPGKVTAWQRFLFLTTAGRRGAWRESAPSLAGYVQELQDAERRIHDLARGLRAFTWLAAFLSAGLSLGFSFAVVLGALTQETITVGSRGSSGRAVSMEAEPALFWFTMAASLVLAIVGGRIAIGCVRSLLRPAVR
jgi:hypothetical protein